MTIKQYLELDLLDQFNRVIDKLKNDCYISDDGIKINICSDSVTIKKEFEKRGIFIEDKTIIEISEELSKLMYLDSKQNIFSKEFKKLRVLKNYITHLNFYLYNYDINKMPLELKKEYSSINRFTRYLKKQSLF